MTPFQVSRRRRLAGLTLAAAAVTATVPAGAALAAESPAPAPVVGLGTADVVPGKYVVEFKAGASRTASERAVTRARRAGGAVGRRLTRVIDGYTARLDADELAAVRSDPAVAQVHAVTKVRASAVQRDAIWNLDRVDQRAQKGNAKYTYAATGAGVTVYVLDTGVRLTHKEFGGRAAFGTATSEGPADCDYFEDGGHGTHVAGSVAGTTFGVAKAARIVDVRVLDGCGDGYTDDIAEGLDWVIANRPAGPAVVNLSLGGSANTFLDQAVQRVVAAGITVVAAAGNEAQNACSFSPARAANAITVGSSQKNDSRDTRTNFGSCVDLFAPGRDIRSAWYGSDSASVLMDGTSMAAPHVAGAAALYLERHPAATPAQVTDWLVKGSTKDKLTSIGKGSPNRLLFALEARKAPPAADSTTALNAGRGLRKGEKICSPNGLYCLTQQNDGNLVLTKPGGRVLWSNGANGSAWTTMQKNGNLVSYTTYGIATWSTKTGGNGVSTLKVQNDGNVVLYRSSDGAATWASKTAQKVAPVQVSGKTNKLQAGQAVYRGGAHLTSANGQYIGYVRASNGKLVSRKAGHKDIWTTKSLNSDWLTLQSDGNLVLYNSNGTAVWSSGTGGKGKSWLGLRNDGQLVLYRSKDNKPMWSSRDGKL